MESQNRFSRPGGTTNEIVPSFDKPTAKNTVEARNTRRNAVERIVNHLPYRYETRGLVCSPVVPEFEIICQYEEVVAVRMALRWTSEHQDVPGERPMDAPLEPVSDRPASVS